MLPQRSKGATRRQYGARIDGIRGTHKWLMDRSLVFAFSI
jgi:hypothetical protein